MEQLPLTSAALEPLFLFPFPEKKKRQAVRMSGAALKFAADSLKSADCNASTTLLALRCKRLSDFGMHEQTDLWNARTDRYRRFVKDTRFITILQGFSSSGNRLLKVAPLSGPHL